MPRNNETLKELDKAFDKMLAKNPDLDRLLELLDDITERREELVGV